MKSGGFSPVTPDNTSALGPNSNTGQKSHHGVAPGALIDFLTVVIPAQRLKDCSATNLEMLLPMIFGARSMLGLSSIKEKYFQFYRRSATIFDQAGQLVGHLGLDGNGDTVCISLSGAGCRWVQNWAYVAHQLEILQARITRVDLAYDDYDGNLINVHALRDLAIAGEGFTLNGRPPKSSFMDDHGGGEGCTLYVGSKGHKQLCVYEKGKQKGDETSPWTRAEVRFYAKHIEAVALDVLTKPLQYLRGAYPVLAKLLPGVCSRLETVVRTVDANLTAMVKWLRNQTGGSLHLIVQALGPEKFGQWCAENVARDRLPSRFAICGAARGDLIALIRNQLCQA